MSRRDMERIARVTQVVVSKPSGFSVLYDAGWYESPDRDVVEAMFIAIQGELPDGTEHQLNEELEVQVARRWPPHERESGGDTFENVEEAVAWARQHAPKVMVRLGRERFFSAGDAPFADGGSYEDWPPPKDAIEGGAAELREHPRQGHRIRDLSGTEARADQP